MRFVFALLVLFAVGVAGADEATPQQLWKRGQALAAQHDYQNAYQQFEAGYIKSQRPLFLFNMAECARGAGDEARARDGVRALSAKRVRNGKLAAIARARLGMAEPPAMAPPATATPPSPDTREATPPAVGVAPPSLATSPPAPLHSDVAPWLTRPTTRAGWAVGSVGVGLALASAVTGGLALATRHEYDDGCRTRCSTATYDKGHALAVATDALLGTAAATALTGVVLLARPARAFIARST